MSFTGSEGTHPCQCSELIFTIWRPSLSSLHHPTQLCTPTFNCPLLKVSSLNPHLKWNHFSLFCKWLFNYPQNMFLTDNRLRSASSADWHEAPCHNIRIHLMARIVFRRAQIVNIYTKTNCWERSHTKLPLGTFQEREKSFPRNGAFMMSIMILHKQTSLFPLAHFEKFIFPFCYDIKKAEQ